MQNHRKSTKGFIAIALTLITWSSILFVAPKGRACSAFFVHGSHAVVAKNLDWYSGEGRILINKRNVLKSAILIDSSRPLQWTSKYASITVTGSGREFPWEGMNEQGLSVNALQLNGSEASDESEQIPTVGLVQWIQFILDTSANVHEAILNAQQVRISSKMNLHYFICDVSADCAVVEYIKGELKIRSGAELPVKALTNSDYEGSLAYYRSLAGQSPQQILYTDWSIESLHRFARAAVWSQIFSQPPADPITYAFGGLFNLAQFVPATTTSPGWSTFWSMAFDLSTRTLSWRTLDSTPVKSVRLTAFDPKCSAEVQALDVNAVGSGDMSPRFSDFTAGENQAAVHAWTTSLPIHLVPSNNVAKAIAEFPRTTRCLD